MDKKISFTLESKEILCKKVMNLLWDYLEDNDAHNYIGGILVRMEKLLSDDTCKAKEEFAAGVLEKIIEIKEEIETNKLQK